MQTGVWPLKEYHDGRVVHTKPPRRRVPVERWLQTQGRFQHLLQRLELLVPEAAAAALAHAAEQVAALGRSLKAESVEGSDGMEL